MLLDKDANINAGTPEGMTSLAQAALRRDRKIVEILLRRGADGTIKCDTKHIAVDWTGDKPEIRELF